MKDKYFAPEVKVMLIRADIITYSENEEWEGPVIQAGNSNPAEEE